MNTRAVLICILGVLLQPVLLLSFSLQEPAMRVNEVGVLVASAGIRNTIPLEVVTAVDDGIRIEVRYQVRLHRYISFFLAVDPLIIEKEIKFYIHYDFIENIYTVENDFLGKKRIFVHREEVWRYVQSVQNIALVDISSLQAGRTYYLRVRLQMRSVRMYPPFSFLSILSYGTDWVRSRELKL